MSKYANTNRNDVPREFTWATEDLFVNDEAWLTAMKAFEEDIMTIAAMKDTLCDSGENLLRFFDCYNAQIRTMGELYNYASLKHDEDTTNPTYQDYDAKATNAYVSWNNATSYLAPKLLSLPEKTLQEFYIATPTLEKYRIAIDEILRLKEHYLNEQGEELLALAADLNDIPSNIFTYLNNADLKFKPVMVEGEPQALTTGNFVHLEINDNRSIRQEAFENFYAGYASMKNTSAAILQGQMKNLLFQAKARHYDSTLSHALAANNVDPAVYHNLIATVRDNIHYMHDYVRLRKKALGVDELHMYDVYAPLVANSSRVVPYEEAVENILKTCRIYGEDYLKVLNEGFQNRWVDRYENLGKRSGAYSNGALVHPYVLMNYADDIDSEFTLIHEMGHSMHSYLSNTHQEPIYADYTIFVAEVASTCNEALLMQYLLKNTTDKNDRILLINHFLEQFKGTLYRQTMFAEFELKINELVAAGETLTADVLGREYRALNEFYFGPDMVLDEQIDLEWSRIPHFYYNYYVYQYATGYSAAIALSNRMLKEGEPAVRDYLNFLKSGCTEDPVSLLLKAGVDMASPAPIQSALELFGELIKEMDELLNE